MDRKKEVFFRQTLQYISASYISQGLSIVNSILLRRFLGPSSMGLWNIIQVILGYCGYASFGTTKAMARDYPYFKGKGDLEMAARLKDMTVTFTMTASVLPAAVIAGYLMFRGETLDPLLRNGLCFLMGFLFVQRFYDLVVVLLRSDKQFGVVSALIVINAVGSLLISLFLVSRFNILGLFLGSALLLLASLAFSHCAHPYPFRLYWNRTELWRELRLGMPLVVHSFLFELLRGLDRLLIGKYLGFYDAGLYSIAIMVSQYVYSLPMMFAHVWYPNLQEDYGSRGSAEAVKNYLVKPAWIFAVLIPFLCALGIYGTPVLVHLFLPQFIPGLLPMKIYLVGTFFLILGQFSANFLVTLDKYLVNIPFALGAIAINLLLNLFFIRNGWGLAGVALATVASYVFYGLATYWAAAGNFLRSSYKGFHVLEILLASTLLYGGIFLVENLVRFENLLLRAAVQMFFWLLFSTPFLWFLEKRTGGLTMIAGLASKKFKKRVADQAENE